MTYNSIEKTIRNEKNFEFQNQKIFFYFFYTFLFSKLEINKINTRSSYINDGKSVTLNLVHISSQLEIKIKVDRYEIYVWIDDLGYSMFQISKQKKYSDNFYQEIIDFLYESFKGNFYKQFFSDGNKEVKVSLKWKRNIYPEATYISIKHLFLEKFRIKKYEIVKTNEYPSFF
jgi:hypothetical protein